ncbi:MAG: dihydrofolate reductase family protein [Desulfobacterales bacterium]|nr:dihydrofolate reductase family protein [Desulfobacterales bacterium]
MKIILVIALTVDGKIGLSSEHFPDWTELADKQMFKRISKESGVIIMGSKTFDTLDKPLPDRKHVVLTRKKHRRSETAQVEFTAKSPAEIVADLEAQGYSQAVLGGGSRVNFLFAQAGLIDEILVTFSPKIFGAGLSLFSDQIQMNLALLETGTIGEHTVFARYQVIRSR